MEHATASIEASERGGPLLPKLGERERRISLALYRPPAEGFSVLNTVVRCARAEAILD